MDLKLELVIVPVADVDRARSFYIEQAGFHLEVDHPGGEDFRVVQMTPDIDAARSELVARGVGVGVGVGEVRHVEAGSWSPGAHPERRDYSSFVDFADPDGNTWLLQERGHTAAGG